MVSTEFAARNAAALKQVRADENIEIRAFPDDVLRELRALAEEVIDDMAAKDPLVARVAESFEAYRQAAGDWTEISEQAMLKSRTL